MAFLVLGLTKLAGFFSFVGNECLLVDRFGDFLGLADFVSLPFLVLRADLARVALTVRRERRFEAAAAFSERLGVTFGVSSSAS